MMKKIIFRADGNSTTGLGHLYRLFSLVEIVKECLEFVFVIHESTTTSIIPENYNKIIVPKTVKMEDEPLWLAGKFPPQSHIIIADGYQFIAAYQKSIKEIGYKLIYIDDLAREHMYADVVVNHSPHVIEKDFIKEPYAKLALGTKYALLRPLFLKEAKQNKAISIIDTAFVCFGGADQLNLSLKAAEALLKLSNFKQIHVVLGGAYQHQGIFNLEKVNSNKLKTYKNLSEKELIKVMKLCNFAIAPASTILYELCCVKMAILSGYYVDNQQLIYKGFIDNRAIYRGENFKDFKVIDFINKIESIVKEQKFNDHIEEQKLLFDDKISSRHLKLIKGLC